VVPLTSARLSADLADAGAPCALSSRAMIDASFSDWLTVSQAALWSRQADIEIEEATAAK